VIEAHYDRIIKVASSAESEISGIALDFTKDPENDEIVTRLASARDAGFRTHRPRRFRVDASRRVMAKAASKKASRRHGEDRAAVQEAYPRGRGNRSARQVVEVQGKKVFTRRGAREAPERSRRSPKAYS